MPKTVSEARAEGQEEINYSYDHFNSEITDSIEDDINLGFTKSCKDIKSNIDLELKREMKITEKL